MWQILFRAALLMGQTTAFFRSLFSSECSKNSDRAEGLTSSAAMSPHNSMLSSEDLTALWYQHQKQKEYQAMNASRCESSVLSSSNDPTSSDDVTAPFDTAKALEALQIAESENIMVSRFPFAKPSDRHYFGGCWGATLVEAYEKWLSA